MKGLDERILFCVPKNDSWRIRITDGYTLPEIVLDCHGFTRPEAERAITNILNIIRENILLVVIHGFHSGTVIRDMLLRLDNRHIVSRIEIENNPGMTWITAA